MHIYEAERRAQQQGLDGKPFELLNESNGVRLKCKWLDCHFGMFTIEGEEGFVSTRQVADLPVVVVNAEA